MQDELTLRELILAIQDYLRYFLRKWYWFVLAALLLGGIFYYEASQEKDTYAAPLTFLMNNGSEKPAGAGLLLGGLGLSGGGSGGGSVGKLMELSKSRQVLSKVLFDSATVDGKEQMVADHLIEIYEYHELWEDNEKMAGFLFNGKRPAANDDIGNRVLKMLHRQMISEEEGIISVGVDEESRMLNAEAVTPNAELSIAIVEKLYAVLSDYFVNASVFDKQESVRLLTYRADSIKTVLVEVEARLARFQDRASNVLLQKESVKSRQLQREAAILNEMYVGVIKNRETAAFILESEKPGFELVDGPLEPLSVNRGDVKSGLMLGVLLGVVLMGVILFFSKLIRDAMKS